MDDKSEIFVTKTCEALTLEKGRNDPRIAPRGFDLDPGDRGGRCVLVIGLNPAGDESDAHLEGEETDRHYLYSLPDAIKVKSPWLYNPYFRPIYKFTEATVGDGVKWPWCNLERAGFETEVLNDGDLSPFSDALLAYYDEHKSASHTIYVGDLFYYHETSSKALTALISKDIDKGLHCKEMLELHVDALRDQEKVIDFIYINNATASHWLCDCLCGNDIGCPSSCTISCADAEIPVVFGGMLSGQRRLDDFSRRRLIDEVRSLLA